MLQFLAFQCLTMKLSNTHTHTRMEGCRVAFDHCFETLSLKRTLQHQANWNNFSQFHKWQRWLRSKKRVVCLQAHTALEHFYPKISAHMITLKIMMARALPHPIKPSRKNQDWDLKARSRQEFKTWNLSGFAGPARLKAAWMICVEGHLSQHEVCWFWVCQVLIWERKAAIRKQQLHSATRTSLHPPLSKVSHSCRSVQNAWSK